MNRVILASVTVAALVGSSFLGWFEVRQTREFRRLLAVGDAALAHDQAAAAIEAYSGAIALRRDSMLGWLKRGDTYRRRGDYAPALRDLQQATVLDPAALQPMELLGDVYAAVGQQARAGEMYSRYLQLDDRAPRVLYKQALANYRSGRAAAAVDPLRKAIALDRQLTEAYYLLGLCDREARRPERAADAFARAVTSNPTFAPAREELIAVDAVLGRRRDTIEQLEALAALEPGCPDHLVNLALTYTRLGRFDNAVLTLERASERYPQSPKVYLALARVWLDAAEERHDAASIRQAARALQAAAAQDNRSPEFLFLRGREQLLSGDAASAERSLQAAAATLPADPAAFRYLAQAATRLHHREVARVARARYIALAP